MMKLKVLAVVVPALLAIGVTDAAEVYNKDGNKVDIYGKVTARHRFSDDKSNNGDDTYARLGFKGESQINSELTGYGRFEGEFSGNSTEDTDVATRLAFAGLKIANVGTIDYGRNWGIAYDSLAYTDVLPEWGGDQSNSDNFLTGRSTGVLTYRNKDFFGLVEGLNFGLQYQGKNNKDTLNKRGADYDRNIVSPHDVATQNGDGFGTSLEYVSPVGVGIIANYVAVNRTAEQNALVSDSGKGKKAQAWGTGLKYDANSIYVAALYSEFRNLSYVGFGDAATATATTFADKTKIIQVVAQYNLDFGLTPSLAYVQAKAQDDANNRNDYISKYVSVGATYALNKNFSVYSEYDINLIKDTNAYGISDDDRVAVGVTYQF